MRNTILSLASILLLCSCQKKQTYDCVCKDYVKGIEDQKRKFEASDYGRAEEQCAEFQLRLMPMSSGFSCQVIKKR